MAFPAAAQSVVPADQDSTATSTSPAGRDGPQPELAPPPPPPVPLRIAPTQALWLGLRPGLFIPFGELWGRCALHDGYGHCVDVDSASFRRFATAGPSLELDAGVRLARLYNVFMLWERAWLGAGRHGDSTRAETDFWALGARISSEPDGLGFVTEVAVGFRRMGVRLADGRELRLARAPFEARLGVGADVRVNPRFSVSPLLSLGVGRFDRAERIESDGTRVDLLEQNEPLAHGWLSLAISAQFDLPPRY